MPRSKDKVIYNPVRYKGTTFKGREIPGDVIAGTKAVVSPNESIELLSWSDASDVNFKTFRLGDAVIDQAGHEGRLVAIKAKIVVIETAGRSKRHSIAMFVERNRVLSLHDVP